MSLFGLFDIGRTAIYASQTALSTVSNNIANVNTPGYSRQEVILDIANPASSGSLEVGNGVVVAGVKRDYDTFIQSQLIGQQQNQGRSDALNQSLSQVEQVFNDVQGMGISSAVNDYFDAWNGVAQNPEGQPERMTLLQKGNTLVTVAKQMESGLTGALSQINEGMSGTVDRINTIASDIASLNGQIVRQEAGGTSATANDLRDQRDALMNELSGLADISTFEDNNGAVTVTMGMRNLVSGEKAYTLSALQNQNGDMNLFLDNIDITDNISKGQLGGSIAARSQIESGPLAQIRKLVASVISQVNQVHITGFGLDQTTGNNFFNPLQVSTTGNSAGAQITGASISNLSQLNPDDYVITFDATNNYSVTDTRTRQVVATGPYVSGSPITFNGIQVAISDIGAGTVQSGDTFAVKSPLTDAIKNFSVAITDINKIAAASAVNTLPGDGTKALALTNLSTTTIADLGGGTFMDYYKGIVSSAGVMSKAASDSLTFDNNLFADIQNRRDSVSGVSLDEEATNLIKFQRSFQAGAKMIQITDELLQTMLNMV